MNTANNLIDLLTSQNKEDNLLALSMIETIICKEDATTDDEKKILKDLCALWKNERLIKPFMIPHHHVIKKLIQVSVSYNSFS
jgi:hypothetical protein